MTTRKNKKSNKSNKSNKRFRKTRSKRGGVINNNIKLIWKSMFGNTEAVENLLKEGADVNAKNCDGYTALILASSNGRTEIVKLLLEKGANVNAKDNNGETALHSASENGHTEIVAKLLEKGADVNAENNYGQTALSLASLNGHTEIVKLLKQYIVAQTFPRHLERQQNRLQVGRVMDSKKMPGDLTHKIITEHFGGKRKTRKAKKSNKKFRKTRSKRQRGGDSEAQEEKDKYLFNAIGIKNYVKVKNALNNGANVNARNKDGDTPLIRAIELEDIDMVYLLLERPDINIELDVDTNKELQLAEDLWDDMTPEEQQENGIPYAIEDYIVTKKEKKRIQNIVAQTIPKHLERQKDRKNLAMVMSEKDVGNRGDGTMPLELRHETGEYLGGGKRKRGGTRTRTPTEKGKAYKASQTLKKTKHTINKANRQTMDGLANLFQGITIATPAQQIGTN